jgi:hypothetical protein
MRGKPKANTIDEYLAAIGDAKRAALEQFRKTISGCGPRSGRVHQLSAPGVSSRR